MAPFLKYGTGYVKNENATTNCAYCQYSVGDEYLAFISAPYSNLWRNFGFYFAYIFFNIFAMVGVYYLFHVRKLVVLNPDSIKKVLGKLHIRKNNT